MTHATEFRIGNLISLSKDVENIDARQITAIQKEVIKHTMNGSDEQTTSPENIYGIRLSPAILEKAGFEKDLTNDDFYYLTIEDFRIASSSDETWLEKGEGDFIEEIGLTHCNYVHELQNLVYALTGKELRISL